MIIEFEPYRLCPCVPPVWKLYYRDDNELYYNEMLITKTKLILFLETFGYETNNILLLQEFGVNTQNINENKKL